MKRAEERSNLVFLLLLHKKMRKYVLRNNSALDRTSEKDLQNCS